MLHSDLGYSRTETQPGAVQGFSDVAHDIKELLNDLSHEIEESRHRHTLAIQSIESRLRRFEQGGQAETSGEGTETTGGWDPRDAEALTRAYEDQLHATPPRRAFRDEVAGVEPTWFGSRFSDLSEQIRLALSAPRSGTAPEIEDRLASLEDRISSALDEVIRRSDLHGLSLIEAQVGDLTAKLEHVNSQVARLNSIDADLRHVLAQVSDERMSALVGGFQASDIDAIARRAAEETRARFADDAQSAMVGDAARFNELRSLVELAIQDWRRAETQATSIVQGVGSAVSAQAQRYEELRELLEASIRERRSSDEQTAVSLDTMQQALVRVLDRMDAIEGRLGEGRQPKARVRHEERPAVAMPAGGPSSPNRPEAAAPAAAPEMRQTAPRDFVAEAQRAKMKAAALRAEGKAAASAPQSTLRVTTPVASLGAETGKTPERKVFGSPKMLAAALAFVVALNGGLLLISKKPSIAPISITPIEGTRDGSGESSGAPAGESVPEGQRDGAEKPRSDAGDGRGLASSDPHSQQPEPATGTSIEQEAEKAFGFGYDGGVLNGGAAGSDETDTDDGSVPAALPSGLMLEEKRGNVSDEVLAEIYQQQVLANLSGRVGVVAAKATPDALLPEASGRIDTTLDASLDTALATPESEAPAGAAKGGSTKARDLPPATVGPLSLRLAAANGDPSAQFEVASRLAEGKGTDQNLKDAAQWYQRSAAQGFAQAQYRLATLFERGLGVEKDAARASVWYKRAAEQGNVKAMHNLAVLSAGGVNGVPDYEGASQWFTKAAEHGLADSQFNLAVLCENGLGRKENRIEAYKWYALAAKSGDKDSLERRDALLAAFSPKERKDAEALVEGFKAQPANALANDPRVAGEDWKKRANNS